MILIIKHVPIEGPGIIGDFFENTSWQAQTIELGKGHKPNLLPNPHRKHRRRAQTIELGKGHKLRPCAQWLKSQQGPPSREAIITLGGPMNVYEQERYPFLKEEDEFLKEAIEAECHILGICLGAQLLAKAAGAEVKKAHCQELGWFKVSLTEEGRKDPLFENLEGDLDVFQWHEDIFEIPQGATLLASSDFCENQAFRFGKNAYGLQFHFEVTPSMVESWIEEYIDEGHRNEDVEARSILLDTYKKMDDFGKRANTILLNFARIVERAGKG